MRADYSLQMNGIQHFVFCPRQWALIEIEQVWEENILTIEGHYLHERADDPFGNETRKDKITRHSIPVYSEVLQMSGVIDTIEYKRGERGIRFEGHTDLWEPLILEYKRGKPKRDQSDLMQLTAQVIAYEEMTDCSITTAGFYYHEIRRRQLYAITPNMKQEAIRIANTMRQYLEAFYTPPANFSPKCDKCSLKEKCLPSILSSPKSVVEYLNKSIEEKP